MATNSAAPGPAANPAAPAKPKLTTDAWALTLALVLAALVGFGVVGKVPW